MSVESECGVCAESVWDVRFVFWCCDVLCCVVMCGVGAGVGAECVVCGVCAWCAWCVLLRFVVVCVGVCVGVCGAAWHAANPPCEGSKRIRVYRQHAHVLKHMCACCLYIRKRFERTHGGVFEPPYAAYLSLSSRLSLSLLSFLSFSRPFSLPSFSSFVLFSLPALVVSLFSLSNNDNDHSSSRALSVHTRL